jgi:hypothetical protein
MVETNCMEVVEMMKNGWNYVEAARFPGNVLFSVIVLFMSYLAISLGNPIRPLMF